MKMIQTKAKESELNPPIPLALQEVALTGWFDASGEEMVSAVVVEGALDVGGVPTRLTAQQQHALDVFRSAAKVYGQLSEDGALAALHVDIWRREYYARFPVSGASMDTKKTAFSRARKRLVEVARLAVSNDMYYFSGIACFIDNAPIVEAIKARDATGTGDNDGT